MGTVLVFWKNTQFTGQILCCPDVSAGHFEKLFHTGYNIVFGFIAQIAVQAQPFDYSRRIMWQILYSCIKYWYLIRINYL